MDREGILTAATAPAAPPLVDFDGLLDAMGAEPSPAAPACACGGQEVHVVFKCPVYAVVVGRRVERVVVARDCAEGPIVAECARCGASDVDGVATAEVARLVAEESAWPELTRWSVGW